MEPSWLVALSLILGQVLSPAILSPSQTHPLEAAASSTYISGLTTVVEAAVVTANAVQELVVHCPDGTNAISGGVDLENNASMYVSTSAPYFATGALISQPTGKQLPAPIGWKAVAVNPESASKQFKVSVTCAQIPGLISIAALNYAAPEHYQSAGGKCPVGTVALGGGVETTNYANTAVAASAPTGPDGTRLVLQPDGNNYKAPVQWNGTLVNRSATDTYILKVAAICAPLDGAVMVITSNAVSGNDFAIGGATCPPKTTAVGGGMEPEALLPMAISSSAPTFGSGKLLSSQPVGSYTQSLPGWQTSVINTGATGSDFKTAVICAQIPSLAFIPFITR